MYDVSFEFSTYWDVFWVILRHAWGHFRICVGVGIGPFGVMSGLHRGMCLSMFAVTLVPCWDVSGVCLG
jgi:hypothetical protein